MRRVTTIILVFVAMAAGAAASAKEVSVTVYLNNRKAKLSPPAIMRNGNVYVSMRCIERAMHACAKWDANTKTAIVTAGNKRKKVKQSEGIMSGGVLFLPLKSTAEAIGCTVEWDKAERCIKVTTEAPCPIGGG